VSINCTPQHLKYAKNKLGFLKGKQGNSLSFCLLRKKGTKEVILHFDKVTTVAKFKNPVSAHNVFKKTAAFRYTKENEFFDDISKIVSVTGVVTNTDGTTLSFQKTVAGRGGEVDLTIACKDLKIKNFVFANGMSEDAKAAETVSQKQILTDLKSMNLPSPSTIAEDPLAHFGSFEALAAAIEALNSTGTGNALLNQYRIVLNNAYTLLQEWSPDGVEAVGDAMDELGGIDDYGDEIVELIWYEQEAMEAMKESVVAIREETKEKLRAKGKGESTKYFVKHGKLIVTLKEGYFRLVPRVKKEFGGGHLLVVNNTDSFEHEATLTELAQAGRVSGGRFKKSKSGKKIALTGISSRNEIKAALRAMGMSLTVYLVRNFDNLQTQLQDQKVAVIKEDKIDTIEDRLSAQSIELPTMQSILKGDSLQAVWYAFLIKEVAAENLGFYLSVRGRFGVLNEEHKSMGSKAVYDDYVKVGSTHTININSEKRKLAQQIGDNTGLGDARFDTIDFEDMLTEIVTLMSAPFQRFKSSRILAAEIYASPTLGALYAPDL
jgi:hypothetical protein